MRISDWSSDVCSSDLADMLFIATDTDGLYTGHPTRDPDARPLPRVEAITPEVMAMTAGGAEVGRASCRDRVGQYVSISVVAVSLKKTPTISHKYELYIIR